VDWITQESGPPRRNSVVQVTCQKKKKKISFNATVKLLKAEIVYLTFLYKNNDDDDKKKEQHTRKTHNQETTENGDIGHCIHTSESTSI
jgi:hypothetical protein